MQLTTWQIIPIYYYNIIYCQTTKWQTNVNERQNAFNASGYRLPDIWDTTGCVVVCFCTTASCPSLIVNIHCTWSPWRWMTQFLYCKKRQIVLCTYGALFVMYTTCYSQTNSARGGEGEAKKRRDNCQIECQRSAESELRFGSNRRVFLTPWWPTRTLTPFWVALWSS